VLFSLDPGTATGSDTTGDLTSNTVNLPITPGSACTPHVTVNKEICSSTLGSKCGPGGSGPWVKQTPGGLLGLLGTARRKHRACGGTALVAGIA
jgi:hypothetical protein